MTRYTFKRALMILTLAVVLSGSATFAAELPFKLSGDGSLLFNPLVTPSGPFVASGHATHLGAWDNLGEITFVPQIDGTLAASGSVVFTAAAGDEIDMVFHGVLDPTTGHGTGTFIIVGGSGRFENAVGSSRMELDQSPDGSFRFTLNGAISN